MWKGCLWRDLDERIAGQQRTRVGHIAVTAGGSRTITEVHDFAKRRLRRSASDHSQSTFWYEMGHNSEKLLGFGALHFDLPAVEMSIYTFSWGP